MGSIGEYSEYKYLSKIMKDVLERGLEKSTLKEKLSEIKRNDQGKSYKMPKSKKNDDHKWLSFFLLLK
ncbi:hypothetical protein BSK52_26605 [Paenibacillus odorifer]|uniref:Uncharacterized protein n=1 Tax=Paenibacillus odorifer TaxID=189426 RepID=A0A1R0XKQ8_9BACL|nr:hypothetical protein BSK52_26605 [Paenibacillus odorifer]